MPRRAVETAACEPPRKRRVPADEDSLTDASLCDDEALPPGLLMTDIAQKTWRIGKPIGRGSFGRIYLASDATGEEVTRHNARYVVKIEPHTNGPLFVEIHALIHRARAQHVKEWRSKNKNRPLGMPIYIASGSFTHEHTDTKYRFLVLPRYEMDLEKIIATRDGVLDPRNVFVLAVQILDVLEYLHEAGYTHSDVKSSNLMVGFDGMKFGKMPMVDTDFLSQVRKNVMKKKRSNYYNDEDFVLREKMEEKDKKLLSVRKRVRKMLSDRSSRNLHRHTAFNLRQLTNHINYEDFNSSICSDLSYQRLIDDKEIKHANDEDKEKFNEAILSQSNGQIYLLDYGLASKFLEKNGEHKEFGMDARKAHDGTLEYSSRDSHIGAHSRRSDLETLGFNILDWLTGTLPWKTTEMLAEPDLVHALKKNYMDDVKTLLKTCFKTEMYPEFLEKYLQYVSGLDFKEKPDYNYCRNIFREAFSKSGFGSGSDMRLMLNEPSKCPVKKLNFSKHIKSPIKSDFKKYGRENMQSLENDLKLELLRKILNTSSDGIRKPCSSRNFFVSDADLVMRLKQSLLPLENFGKKLSPKNLRSKKRLIQKKRGKRTKRNSIGKFGNFLGSGRQYSWAEILAGKPEDLVKTMKTKSSSDDEESKRNRKISSASEVSVTETQSPLLQKDYLDGLNPTYAMKEIHLNFRKKMLKKNNKETEYFTSTEGKTPAMVKVIQMRERREAKERKNKKNKKEDNEVKDEPATPMKMLRKRNLPTPIRKVLESKRKPIVRVEKTKKIEEDIINNSKKQSKSNTKKSQPEAATAKPQRRAVRLLTNQRVTRSARRLL